MKVADKEKGLSDALRYLKKEIAGAFDTDEKLTGISTGSLAVDIITGIGGFPRGRIAEVFGWEASGKTTLCMMACAAAQSGGLYPVYIDTERGVDLVLARNIGWATDDEKKGLYLTPDSFEETVRIVERLTETGDVDLVIVDSVPGMVPQSVFDGKIDETGRIGEVARLLASVLPRLTKTAEKNNTAVVFINQMRQVVDTSGFRPAWASREQKEKTFGGSALKFFSSLRLDLRIVQKGAQKTKRMDHFTAKEVEVPTANLHEAQAFKNKVAAPYRKATFTIRFDETRGLYGIDNRQTVIDLATSYGVIQHKGGGNYFYEGPVGNFTVRGADALYDFVASRPDIAGALFEAVTALPEIKAALQR